MKSFIAILLASSALAADTTADAEQQYFSYAYYDYYGTCDDWWYGDFFSYTDYHTTYDWYDFDPGDDVVQEMLGLFESENLHQHQIIAGVDRLDNDQQLIERFEDFSEALSRSRLS